MWPISRQRHGQAIFMLQDNPTDLTELNTYLDSLIIHGIKLGLHNIRQIMEREGNPQNLYPVLHVAGTNGKGSVVAFVDAILRQSGYITGRFTSPHLISLNERFLVRGIPISNSELYDHLRILRGNTIEAGISPTYFEMNTAIAFRAFAHHHVDIALIEVGMGGRFDSTNIVQPAVCAITSIDYDHTQYLGETLEKIAFEKAGILKQDIPAVIGTVAQGPLNVIKAQALRVNAPLHLVDEDYHVQADGTSINPLITYQGMGIEITQAALGLSGMHQVYNAAIAITIVGLLKASFPNITTATILEGLKKARWPGRLELVSDSPPVFMDVAHNPAGCRVLAETFRQCITVFAVSSDKNVSAMLDILAPISSPFLLTEYSGSRSMPLAELQIHCTNYPHKCCPDLRIAIKQGMELASPEKPLLITGSIYAVGEARQIMMEEYGVGAIVF